MDRRSIYAVVVVYNTACRDSVTCKNLMAMREAPQVLIYDNSTRDYGNRAWCERTGWQYLGGEGNKGLSRAYNACIDWLKADGAQGYVCLFDDDTQVDEGYFEALDRAVEGQDEAVLLVPRIYSAGRLLSPCRVKGVRSGCFADEGEMWAAPSQEMSAINSGMAISLRLFEGYRYDEGIFLDGIDHRFVADMRARGHVLTVMDYSCEHSFSGNERPPKVSALTRYRIFSRDQAYILCGKPLDYLYVAGKRALKLSVQYKTPVFLGPLFRGLCDAIREKK